MGAYCLPGVARIHVADAEIITAITLLHDHRPCRITYSMTRAQKNAWFKVFVHFVLTRSTHWDRPKEDDRHFVDDIFNSILIITEEVANGLIEQVLIWLYF